MIRARGLSKDFHVSRSRTVHAVRGVDLDVADGELVAVLGPNGAGKTTTIRMLTTLTRPTAGTATVAGHDVVSEPHAVRRAIGFVGQGNGAGHAQHVRDELVSHGRMLGLPARRAVAAAEELLDVLDLREQATRKVESLSGGQRRRLDVALGLVHAPGLLFLDEPSTGLDPHNRANLWEHLQRLRERHAMTVVLTTHYLEEADSMAERVVVVDHGRVIADATADSLKRDLAGDRVVVEARTPDDAGALARIVERLPGARAVTVDGVTVQAGADDGPGSVPGLVAAALAADVPLAGVQAFRPTLDDVFLALTGRSLREHAGTPSGDDDHANGTGDTHETEAARAAGKDAA